MIKNPSFYAVIIGSELLNGRRSDGHFAFLNAALVKRGWEQKASFVIKDEPSFLYDIFSLIKSDPNAVMISFGGIGATPDDFTREIAAKAFTDKPLTQNPEAAKLIIDRLGDRAYPHPIKMADIPEGSKLIHNPVNRVPGFQLEDRFFFVPGFPQMAHPMIIDQLDTYYPKNKTKHSCNFIAHCSEGMLIDVMEQLDPSVELSCLPGFDSEKRWAEIYLAHVDATLLESQCRFFKTFLKENNIYFTELTL